MKLRCIVMAFHDDGTPKRDVGVFYPDIGVYTQEMYDIDHNVQPKKRKKRSKKA